MCWNVRFGRYLLSAQSEFIRDMCSPFSVLLGLCFSEHVCPLREPWCTWTHQQLLPVCRATATKTLAPVRAASSDFLAASLWYPVIDSYVAFFFLTTRENRRGKLEVAASAFKSCSLCLRIVSRSKIAFCRLLFGRQALMESVWRLFGVCLMNSATQSDPSAASLCRWQPRPVMSMFGDSAYKLNKHICPRCRPRGNIRCSPGNSEEKNNNSILNAWPDRWRGSAEM